MTCGLKIVVAPSVGEARKEALRRGWDSTAVLLPTDRPATGRGRVLSEPDDEIVYVRGCEKGQYWESVRAALAPCLAGTA